MKRVRLAVSLCLLATTLGATPPHCKTEERNGQSFNVCKRPDVECEALAKEQVKDPSSQWNGCIWDALITQGHFSSNGVIAFATYVAVTPSFRDSERMDVTVTIEQADHTFRKYVRKDVPIIVEDGIASATVNINTPDEPVGVPTVDSTEKGGKKEVSHRYR